MDKYTITERQVEYARMQKGLLFEPEREQDRKDIAVVIFYLHLYSIRELARRGFPALFIPTEYRGNADERMKKISDGVSYMRSKPGVRKVVAMSWSGGCAPLTAYQAVAENGADIFRGPEMVIPCTDYGNLDAADGLIMVDSNWGATMTLLSLDPAVRDETTGLHTDPAYDYYAPESGYQEGGCAYKREFFEKYTRAQGRRMNSLIGLCQERIRRIDAGEGLFEDDEVLVIPGGEQIKPCNKLINQDVHLFSHTKGEYPLLHGDGSVTTEVIRSVRVPEKPPVLTSKLYGGSKITSMKNFLREDAVPVGEDYTYGEDGFTGVHWERTYTSAVSNIRHVSVPILTMGMTAGYEYLVSESIFQNAVRSRDRKIAFVEGANHIFQVPEELKDCGYGDTEETTYDYIAGWLTGEGRF